MKKLILIVTNIFISCTLLYSGEISERQQIIDQSSELFKKGDYKSLSNLAKTYRDTEERTSSGRWKIRFVYYGIYKTIDVVVEEKYNNNWDKLEQELLDWTKLQPKDPLPYITYANVLISKAWMYRGNRYVANTPKENWVFFETEVDKAVKYLLKHKDIASQDPHWYTAMLRLAKSDSWNRPLFYAMVNEAINRYPHYYSIYAFTLHYMNPKWNGFTKEEIENIAQIVLRASKDQYGAYARYYLTVQDTLGDYIPASSLDINWSTMQNSMKTLVEKYPTQHNINVAAYFSCLANQKKTAQVYIDQMVDKPILEIWETKENYDACSNLSTDNISITTITPDKAIDYISSYEDKKPLVIYFSSYKKDDVLKDVNKINKFAKEYKDKVNFLSVNFYPNKLVSYPELIKKFSLDGFELPLSMYLYKGDVIYKMNESVLRKYTKQNITELIKKEIDRLSKKGDAHSSQQKISKDNLVRKNSHNYIPVESSIKEIPTDKIEEYVDNYSNNRKPLVVYFDYAGTKYRPSPGLKHIAQKYKNEFNIVNVYFDLSQKDAAHLSIKKRFDMRSCPNTIIIHKNKVVYNGGGNLNSKYSRKELDKDIAKYIRDHSADFYTK